MVKLVDTISLFGKRRIMLLGDFMLDNYTVGKVRRISPEAPVPVINVTQQFDRPGGAGNVLLNFASLGLSVIPIGRIGADSAGQRICEAFRKEGASTEGLLVQNNYATPVKNRVIADNQQLLRLDFEESSPLLADLEERAFAAFKKHLSECSLIAISDYGKGFLTPTLLKRVIGLAKEKGVPVIVDPKGKDFSRYKGATVIKPNLSEAYAASLLPASASLKEVARDLLDQTEATSLFVTKSDEGISLYSQDDREEHFSVKKVREVRDVTGAGDTVLAVLACALANDLSLTSAARLANIAAGIAVEQVGCARVSLADIASRLYEEDIANKICDEKHLFLLETVLKDNPFVFFIIDTKENFERAFFRQLRKYAHLHVLVQVKGAALDSETVEFLATLEEVNFLLFEQSAVDHILAHFIPEVTIDLASTAVPLQ